MLLNAVVSSSVSHLISHQHFMQGFVPSPQEHFLHSQATTLLMLLLLFLMVFFSLFISPSLPTNCLISFISSITSVFEGRCKSLVYLKAKEEAKCNKRAQEETALWKKVFCRVRAGQIRYEEGRLVNRLTLTHLPLRSSAVLYWLYLSQIHIFTSVAKFLWEGKNEKWERNRLCRVSRDQVNRKRGREQDKSTCCTWEMQSGPREKLRKPQNSYIETCPPVWYYY